MSKVVAIFSIAGLLFISVEALGAENNWQMIDRSRSNVSFIGDDSFVLTREWQRRSNGTQERLKFAGGEIFYEELYYSGGTWIGVDRKQYLRNWLAKSLNKNAQLYVPGDFQSRNFAKYSFVYMLPQSSSSKCMLGVAAEENDGRTWHMNFSACRALNSTAIATFEQELFDILERVRFDGGTINKARTDLPSQPRAQATTTTAPSADTQPNSLANAPSKRTAKIRWDAYPNLIETSVSLLDQGSLGEFSLELPKEAGKCLGRFQASTQNGGIWSAACQNGVGATGTFESPSADGEIIARGKDFKGQNIEITIAAVQIPAGQAHTPQTVTYPKLGPVSAILDGMIIKESLKKYVMEYQTKSSPKALVLSEDGQSLYWANRAAGLESAVESAVSNCQTKTKQTCYVIAANDDLALNLDAIKNKSFK